MAAEVDAHAFVVDHHVHATIVAVANGRLAFTVQYLAAHVLDVGDTLERFQIVTTVVSGEEETDIVLPHIALNPLGSVHLGREVGKHQQVGRAESITAETIMLGLVEERSAAGSMTGRKDDLYLSAAKVYHFAIVEILDLSLVITHIVRNDGHVACIQIDLGERPYPTRMVTVVYLI